MHVKNWGVALAALCGWASVTRAEAPVSCASSVTRRNIVECALASSAALQVEREGVAAAVGRQRSVNLLLPSNPVLALSGGHRSTPQLKATNWYGTLSQEVEIAGQRGARRSAVGAERAAQEENTRAASRDVSRDAWLSYFAVLAAREALAMSQRLEQAFGKSVTAIRAAAENGLAAGIDADIAEATALRLTQERILAERRSTQAMAALATQLGADPFSFKVAIDGELLPLSNAMAHAAVETHTLIAKRPELRAIEDERASYEEWTRVYRKSRAPNLTFSVFAQRDGFNERVLGGGVALPIPLPSPVGHTFAGEIEENAALARRASQKKVQMTRELKLEVANAIADLQAAKAQQDLFTSERAQRAEISLASIAAEIGTGRLAIGSVVVAQQALIEVLRSNVEARLAVCVASVELARAAGLPLAGEGL